MSEKALQRNYKEKAAAQQQTLPATLTQTMAGLMPQIPALLPSDIPVEQFRASLYLELSSRQSLAECTRESLRDCVIKAATYGLLPGRDCHLLPFRNKKGNNKLATYVPNYFGIITALERTGKVRRAFAHAVYSKDVFEVDYFADRPVHKPALGADRGTLKCFYGCVLLKDGSCHFEVMTLDQIDAIRKRAPAHDEGPWVTDYEQMARKTALKRVAKYVRLTPQIAALLTDEDTRDLEDISPARHAQNIVDLFGEGDGRYEAGQPTRPPEEAPPRTPPPHRDMVAWDTLEAHQDDAALPPELLERIAAALSPLARASDGEAFTLANEVLAYLDSLED